MSDLHFEVEDFQFTMPEGDVLIVAGDLCNASCLSPVRTDPFAVRQRDRVMRFADAAMQNFGHVLMVAGNHEHYDGILEETVGLLRAALPGIRLLDCDAHTIGGVAFFGMTLWSDFDRGSATSLEASRRGVGDYYFIKTRAGIDRDAKPRRLRPEETAQWFDQSLAALTAHLDASKGQRTVVISHHAPSYKGLNPKFAGNGLDGAYGSDLDDWIGSLENVPVWVHGHTHVVTTYRLGRCEVRANCRGFTQRDQSARLFKANRAFEL